MSRTQGGLASWSKLRRATTARLQRVNAALSAWDEYYEATSYTCCCPDARKHAAEGLRCKHAWSLEILAVASVIASREAQEAATVAASQDADILDLDPDARIPFLLTTKGDAAIAEPAPIVA